MGYLKRLIHFAALGAVVFQLTGCASIDRFGAKMGMVANRIFELGPLEYEGRVEAVRHLGSMTAIQFQNGPYYDVAELTVGFVRGDVVRIYKTDKGYEARLSKLVSH